MEAPLTTLRLTFAKTGPARWIGHLDLMRAFERAFRRAAIRVAHTQGHNPRPRLRFAFPASVGLICHADIVFADLEPEAEPLSADRLNAALPPGILVTDVVEVPPDQARSALAAYCLAEYRIALITPDVVSSERMQQVVRELVDVPALTLIRSTANGQKEVDVRPYIADLRLESLHTDRATVRAVTRFGSEGTVKPSEIAEILQRAIGTSASAIVERLRLLTVQDNALGCATSC